MSKRSRSAFGNSSGGGFYSNPFAKRQKKEDKEGENSAKSESAQASTAPPPDESILQETSVEQLFQQTKKSGINFDKYEDLNVTIEGTDPPAAVKSFEDAGFVEPIPTNIRLCKYEKPTPIQKHSFPIIMGGRDLLASAQTGSGKTAAYLLPIISSLVQNGVRDPTVNAKKQSSDDEDEDEDMAQTSSIIKFAYPSALIMVPTRELAMQVSDEARKFSNGTEVRVVAIFGGQSASVQKSKLKTGCDILVATPGRLCDFLGEQDPVLFLSYVKYFVMDEADKMLDQGFEEQLRFIMKRGEIPKEERQSILFSATFSKQVQYIALTYLKDYLHLSIGKIGTTNEFIKQRVLFVRENDKQSKLLEELKTFDKGKTIVFFRTKVRILQFEELLPKHGHTCNSLHGDKDQYQRAQVLKSFKASEFRVLLATDVAARGIDVENVEHVINYDFPDEFETYIHRIGRTGRAGKSGVATTFMNYSSFQFAPMLYKLLIDSKQDTPEWIKTMALNQQKSWNKGNDILVVQEARKEEYGTFVNMSAPEPAAETSTGSEFRLGDLLLNEIQQEEMKEAPEEEKIAVRLVEDERGKRPDTGSFDFLRYDSLFSFKFPLNLSCLAKIKLPDSFRKKELLQGFNTEQDKDDILFQEPKEDANKYDKPHALFVYGLPGVFDHQKFVRFFSKYGKIQRFFIKGDASYHVRFGTVVYENKDQAMLTKEKLDKIEFAQRTLRLTCLPESEKIMIWDAKTVCISNLPTFVTEQDLQQYFKQQGLIKNIFLIKKDYTTSETTQAYIEFDNFMEAQNAIKNLDHSQIASNQKIRVTIAFTYRKSEAKKKTVKVSNYGTSISREALITIFSQCGTIHRLEYVHDDYKQKRYAYVEYEHSWDALRSCWLNGTKLGGEHCKVKFASFDLSELQVIRQESKIQDSKSLMHQIIHEVQRKSTANQGSSKLKGGEIQKQSATAASSTSLPGGLIPQDIQDYIQKEMKATGYKYYNVTEGALRFTSASDKNNAARIAKLLEGNEKSRQIDHASKKNALKAARALHKEAKTSATEKGKSFLHKKTLQTRRILYGK